MIPTEGGDGFKQTNEIKIAAPLLDGLDFNGVTITADALLTQREFARHLIEECKAHYHFTAKGNQQTLLEAIQEQFEKRGNPDYVEPDALAHGRIESRRIWMTTALNDYLNFPYVEQAFCIERQVTHKKTGKQSDEVIFGITSQPPEQATPQQVLATNRNHWVIENSCHYIIDWIFDEDRSQIRTGHGPENMTRLRRFAVGLLKSRGVKNISQKIRQMSHNSRMVFDYLRMTKKYSNKYSIVIT